jgi:proteasome lid subunit RPN8/RPN11
MGAAITVSGTKVRHSGPSPYTARSASDRNPAWPFWIIVDAVGFNGISIEGSHAKLFDRETATLLAQRLNEANPT